MGAGFVLVGIFGFVAAIMFAVAIHLTVRHSKYKKQGIRIEGTVVRLAKGASGGSNQKTIYRPIVEFMDDNGKVRRVTSKTGGDNWDDMLGTPLDVIHLPDRPETAMVDLDVRFRARPFYAFGVVMLLVCGFYLLLYSSE
jgi:hypothetical protein